MNSLRFRLILGFSLVAIVPLAVAMVLLSQRIQSALRTQATERLSAALGILEGQLRTDGERIDKQLEILVKDPQLKRLYLVQPTGGPDLAEHLAEQQFLLGLDFLLIADTSGALVADGSTAPSTRTGREAFDAGTRASGLVVEALESVPALAMATSAPIVYRNQTVGIVRGGVVLDAALLARLKQTSGLDLVLHDARGRVVATTLGSDARAVGPLRDNAGRVLLGDRRFLIRRLSLAVGPEPHASIAGLVSTASADQTIATLRRTSLFLGLLGVGIAITLGVLWSLQVSRPVERLASFSQRIARGDWDEPLELRSVRELQTLVAALDRMRQDLHAYRERLVASERHAAWSQMARKVAHELRNPLTPIAVSVADLKRSYDQKRPDFPEILDQAVETIGDEVQSLKRLLHEFAEFGRFPSPQLTSCRLSDLMADLETLYGRDVAEGRMTIGSPDTDLVFRADRGQLRQALVNLVKNGLEAVDGKGRVSLAARVEGAALEVTVADTGPGLGAEQRARLFVPDFTTKTHGSGLGLAIVERIVNDHGGTITVDSVEGRGTTFRIRLPLAPEAM